MRRERPVAAWRMRRTSRVPFPPPPPCAGRDPRRHRLPVPGESAGGGGGELGRAPSSPAPQHEPGRAGAEGGGVGKRRRGPTRGPGPGP